MSNPEKHAYSGEFHATDAKHPTREYKNIIALPHARPAEFEKPSKLTMEEKVEKAWEVLSFSEEDNEKRYAAFVAQLLAQKSIDESTIPALRQLERKNALQDKRMLLAEFLSVHDESFTAQYTTLVQSNTLRQEAPHTEIEYTPFINKLEIARYWRESVIDGEAQGALMLEQLYRYLHDTVHADIDSVQEDLAEMNTLDPKEIIQTLEKLEKDSALRTHMRLLAKKGAIEHDAQDASRANKYKHALQVIESLTPPADAEKAELVRRRLLQIKNKLLQRVAEQLHETETTEMLDQVDDTELEQTLRSGEHALEKNRRYERLQSIEDILEQNIYDKALKECAPDLARALHDIGFDCVRYPVDADNNKLDPTPVTPTPENEVHKEKVVLYINPESDMLDKSIASVMREVNFLNAKTKVTDAIKVKLSANHKTGFDALSKSKVGFSSFDFPTPEEAEAMLVQMRSGIAPGKEHAIAIFTKQVGKHNTMAIKAMDTEDMFVQQEKKDTARVLFQDGTNFAGVVCVSFIHTRNT